VRSPGSVTCGVTHATRAGDRTSPGSSTAERLRRTATRRSGQPGAAARPGHRPHHPRTARPAGQPAPQGLRRGRPVGFNRDRCIRRNVVERGFCEVEQWRGLAIRYDKHARNYAGALNLAALLTWLP
jgi:Transposase DDE domain